MHRYTLEPYHGPASRYTCPQCNQKRTFSRYIDTETNNHLGNHVGRCSRESKCGYHFKPGEYLGKGKKSIADSRWTMAERENRKYTAALNHGPSTMDHSLLTRSLTSYQHNVFANWLVKLFGEDIAGGLISKYLIGTSKHWPGATVFWQIAIDGSIRTGKIMLYADDGKRVKKPFNHINWAHSLLVSSKQLTVGSQKTATANCTPATANFILRQCLFGEHLLKECPDAPVAIVESEKSAIIASVYLPGFVWLAAGGLSNLRADKCAGLKGRNVTLFPDLGSFDKWTKRAAEIKIDFKVSPLLELNATDAERIAGLDLADYLLKYNYREFIAEREKPKAEIPKDHDPAANERYSASNPQPVLNLFAQTFGCDARQVLFRRERIYKRPVWDNEIDELRAYFNKTQLPDGPIRLNNCSLINDARLFVKNHLDMVSHNNGNSWHKVYFERLSTLKTHLESA